MQAEALETTLTQFTGTSQYYRFHADAVLTDGVLWLADNAHCYWLLDVFYSYLFLLDGDKESFTVLTLTTSGRSGKVVIDDGNDNLIAQQEIEYTEFPLAQIKLYGCWDGQQWIMLLPSEY